MPSKYQEEKVICPKDIKEKFGKLSDERKERACAAAESLLDGWLIDQGLHKPVQKEESPRFHIVFGRSEKKCLVCGGPMDEVKYPGGSFSLCQKNCNEHDLMQIIINRKYLNGD